MDSGDESDDGGEETSDEEDGKSEGAADRESSSAAKGKMVSTDDSELKPKTDSIEKAALAREAEASTEEAVLAPAEEVEVPEEAASGAAPASEPVAGEGGVCSAPPSLSTGTPVADAEEATVAAEMTSSKETSKADIVSVKESCAIEVGLQDGTDVTPLPTPP